MMRGGGSCNVCGYLACSLSTGPQTVLCASIAHAQFISSSLLLKMFEKLLVKCRVWMCELWEGAGIPISTQLVI